MSPPKYPPGRPYSNRSLEMIPRKIQNERNPCAYPGGCTPPGKGGRCFKGRSGVGKWCVIHSDHMKQFGHPDAHAIRIEAYRMEQEAVRSILKRNAGWQGVKAAEAFFETWLKSAQLGDNVPGRRDMAHMADQGVTGADCVQAAAVIWVYSAWHPGQLPDDDRLTFALALAVLKGASRKQRGVDWDEKRQRRHFTYRHICSTTRREIGKYIRESLGVFFIHLTEALAQEEQIENKRKMELRAKFPVNTASAAGEEPAIRQDSEGEPQ